jgi:hypothetical protein
MVAAVRNPLALCFIAILACAALAAGSDTTRPMTVYGASAVAVNPQSLPPPLPAPAAPPTLDELNALLASLSKVPFVDPAKQPPVIRLDDDWLTKGDCLGRYGRYWGCWAAICSPEDYLWGAGPQQVEYVAQIGLNHMKYDSIRYWIHWLYTQNPNSLEIPPTFLHSRVFHGLTTWNMNRRQAEWDDHGEAYPMSKSGPGLYCTVRIPEGLYCLSLYNFNKDGHGGANRFRDFTVSVRGQPLNKPLDEIADFGRRPELARGRMRDFWGSVYERYLVRGPTTITVEVDRNHSFCTILAGVFLDLVDEEPVPYFHALDEWQALGTMDEKLREALRKETSTEHTARFQPGRTETEAAARLFEELERSRLTNAAWWAAEGRRYYVAILRWTQGAYKESPAGPEKQRLLARATTCQYQLGLYEKWEAGQVALGKRTARQIEKSQRWDEKMYSCSGNGYQIVTESLKPKETPTRKGEY